MRKILLLIPSLAFCLLANAQVVSTVAGTAGQAGWNPITPVPSFSTALFTSPFGVAVDAYDRIWVTENVNSRVRLVNTGDDKVYHKSGYGGDPSDAGSFGYINATSTSAKYDDPRGLIVNSSGVVYVCDYNNHAVRASSAITTNAAANQAVSTYVGQAPPQGFGDLVDANGTSARFDHPSDICVDANGNLYVADNYNEVIRKINTSGDVTTLCGMKGMAGDVDGTGTAARFNNITAIAMYDANNLVVVDSWNNKIRKININTGAVTTVAGLGVNNFDHVDGDVSVAKFRYPTGIAVDALGNIFVSEGGDGQSNVIRKISGSTVSTIAGKYQSAVTHQDGNDTASRFFKPMHMAFNSDKSILYVADAGNHVIRAIDFHPVAGFFASPTSTNVNVTVKFTDESNGATGWSWSITPTDFTYINGTSATSQNPEVKFTQTGSYTVTLTASNDYGNDAATKSNYINISAINTTDPPVAAFSASKTTGYVGDTIFFTDQSTNSPSSWEWLITPSSHSYINGTDNSSQNPEVQFTGAGSYTVGMKATNTNGSNTKLNANYINISPLGISKIGLEQLITVFPNPSNGSISITSDIAGMEFLNVTLYDINGKTVSTQNMNKLQERIEFNGLSTGMYMLVVSDGNQSFTKKVIVK